MHPKNKVQKTLMCEASFQTCGTQTEFQNQRRKISVCSLCGNFLTKHDDEILVGNKVIENRNIQYVSSEQFRGEVVSLKKIFNDESYNIINDIDASKKNLEGLISEGAFILKHDQGFVIAIDETKETDEIKKQINNIIFDVRKKLSDDFRKKNYNLRQTAENFLLICKHYKVEDAFRSALEVFLKTNIPGNGEMIGCLKLDLINDFFCVFIQYIVYFIVFDLMLDGSIGIESGLFFCIWEKCTRDIRLDVPFDYQHNKLYFKFDQSSNVQLLWALFSILDYWKISDEFLDGYQETLKNRTGVDLYDNSECIHFLCMRDITVEQINEMFKKTELGYAEHFHRLERDKLLEGMAAIEKTVFLLESFMVSEKVTTIKTLFSQKRKRSFKLYDCFKQVARLSSCRSDPLRVIMRCPIHVQSEVDKHIMQASRKFQKFQNDCLFSTKIAEMKVLEDSLRKKMLQDIEEDFSKSVKELENLKNAKISLIFHHLFDVIRIESQAHGTITSFVKESLQSIFDPISLEVIKEAVITPSGYTYDKNSIVRIINDSGKCPMTRMPLSLDQLFPNRVIQNIIDGLSTETKQLLDSGIEDVNALININ